jgi:hypothetical protein
MVLPVLGAAFLAAGSIASAVGLTVAIAGVSLATIATVAGVAMMAVSMLTMQVPSPSSAGTQLDVKLDTKAPVPVLYGHTATGGTVIYRETSGKKNAILYMAVALSVAGPIGGIEYTYANDALVNFTGAPATRMATVASTTPTSKKLYQNKLGVRYLHGEAPSKETISQAFGTFGPAPNSPGHASGHALALVRAEYDTDQFPQGLPKFKWTAFGVSVYDPRKDSTYPGGVGSHRLADDTTWEFSENPYLCALHWTLGKWRNGRKICGIGAKPSEVDLAAFVRGANVADANGWTCGGVVTSGDDKFSVLATILASGGGVPIARGAMISCLVNTPVTAVTTITSSDVVGDFEVQASGSFRDRYNAVIPTYREPTQFWNLIQGEEVSSAVYVAEDNGQVASQEVELMMVQRAAQAHQLATYKLVNSREFLTFTAVLKMRALALRVGDAAIVDIPEIAAEGVKCIVTNREYSPDSQTVAVTFRSENDGKHAFALGQSQVAPASLTLNGYDPSDMDAPGALAWSVQGGQITSENGTAKPIIRVTGAYDNPYAREIIIEFRPAGTSSWIQYGVYPRDTTTIEIAGVTTGTAYEVAVSYRSILNATSDRTIYGPGLAGDESFAWSSVGGAGKPEDNATVGAPSGTPVGDRDADDVTEAIDQHENVIKQLPDLVTSLIHEPIEQLAALHVKYGAINMRKSIALAEGNAVAIRDLRIYVDETGAIVSEDLLNLTSRMRNNEAGLLDLSQTYASDKEALASQLTDIIARTDENEGRILDEKEVRTTENAATASTLSQLQAKTGDIAAAIEDVRKATTDLESATAERATRIETRVGNAETAISAVQKSVNDGSAGTSQQITQLGTRIPDEKSSREAGIQEERTARVNGDGALSNRIDTLSSDFNTPGTGIKAVVQTIQQTEANNNWARAQEITTLQSRLNSVNGSGASIENRFSTLATLEGNLQSAWTLKVQQDINGQLYVAGGGLVMENGLSSMSWTTDSFRIMSPGRSPQQVFYADPTGVYIQNASIGNAAIDTLKVAGGAITANQVVTAGDMYVPANTTRTYLETGWMTIGDGVSGNGLVDVFCTIDGNVNDQYDAACIIRLYIDTGGGWQLVRAPVMGVGTNSGDSYWRIPGILKTVVTGAQVRVRADCQSTAAIQESVARNIYVRDIVMTLVGTKR